MSHRVAFLALALLASGRAYAQTPGAAPGDSSTAAAPPASLATPVSSTPPDFPRGKISGYMFGDYYYDVSGDPNHVYDANGADLGKADIDGKGPITKDLNGIQVRRVYFQLDNDLSARFATRFRLEADGKSLTSDGKVGVAVKAAYLQAKSAVPRGDLFFGMLSTPAFENSEEFWQYRAIEKTLADFWGVLPSADLGLELKGFADPGHHVGYSAMVSDGNGQKAESDRFKRVALAVPLRFGDLRIEPYADYQAVRSKLDKVSPVQPESAAVNGDLATYKIFAGYEFRRFALGAEAVDRVTHRGPAPNQEPRGFSLFARGTLTPTLGAFARFDDWMPDHRLANRVDTQLWIAGLDWQPLKDVHVMPNLEATQYVAQGTGSNAPAHHDLQARITFFYKFSKPQS